VNVVLAIVLFPHFGVQGLALAWSAAYFVAAGVALVGLRRRIGSVPDADAIRATVRAGTAALAMAVVAAPIAGAVGRSSPASALLATAAAGAAGVVVYGAGLMLLRSDELTSLVGLVRRRNTPTPDD
jgi:putative peptidoglycan lipid II flippase